MDDESAFTPYFKRKQFAVYLSKDYMKFNAAHFIAFKGYRERIHGHNYRVGLKIWGERGTDGYVIDFLLVKKALRELCKKINDHVIIPVRSDVLKIKESGKNIEIICEDGSFFSFPKLDCKLLPIVHSSAEELAEYMLWCVIEHFTEDYLTKERKIVAMELSVAEAENQYATHYVDFTEALPTMRSLSPKKGIPCSSSFTSSQEDEE